MARADDRHAHQTPRQRLVRALSEEIVVDVDDATRDVVLVVHTGPGACRVLENTQGSNKVVARTSPSERLGARAPAASGIRWRAGACRCSSRPRGDWGRAWPPTGTFTHKAVSEVPHASRRDGQISGQGRSFCGRILNPPVQP